MKKLLIAATLILFCGLTLIPALPAAAVEYTIRPAVLQKSGGAEVLRFTIGSQVPYKIFALKGSAPRIVIDFPGGKYNGKKESLLKGSSLVKRVRSAWHATSGKSRVVIDLMADGMKFSDTLKDGVLSVRLSSGSAAAAAQPATGVATSGGEKAPKISARTVKKHNMVNGHQLHSISVASEAAGGEKINFVLNGFYPPTITTGEGSIPQVFCFFKGVSAEGVEDLVTSGSALVEEIRVAQEAKGVKVTLDLVQNKDFNLHQFFYRDLNTFSLVIDELPAQ